MKPLSEACGGYDPQRLRLDRARAASHDLNRLLDEPGPGGSWAPRRYLLWKYAVVERDGSTAAISAAPGRLLR
jgi:hypothetical protein